MTTRRLCLCLAGLLSWILPLAEAPGADPSPVAIAQRLQSAYEKTASLSADFRQITAVRMSGREKRGSGTMAIRKPGLMRWDYLTPDRQVLVSNGTIVSMYFAQAAQMIVTSAKEYLQSDVTYAFFTGTGDILRDFEALPPDGARGADALQDYVIKLIPRESHPQVQDLHLWVDRETYLINRLQITDQFGSITDLLFSDIKTNIDLPASLFSFTPPPGTEIITQ